MRLKYHEQALRKPTLRTEHAELLLNVHYPRPTNYIA